MKEFWLLYKDILIDGNVATIPNYLTKKVRWRTNKIIETTNYSKEEISCLLCCKKYQKQCLAALNY